MRKLIIATTVGMLVLSAAPAAFGQDDKFVSKEEYQKLQRKYEALDKEMEEFRSWKKQMQEPPPVGDKAVAEKGSLSAGQMATYVFPGTSRSLLTGYGSARATIQENSDSLFTYRFNPVFLYKVSDKILFEGEIEFEPGATDTETIMELAHLSYLANDYVTVDAGLFLNPANAYDQNFHVGWIRKFPDHPLAVHGTLIPTTQLGVQLRGGVPAGPTKFNYAAFIANAPSLNTPSGTLQFDNFSNVGGHVAYGGRVGFFPIPELEIGYGLQHSGVGADNLEDAEALIQSVDLNYVRDVEALSGVVRLTGQYVWSEVDDVSALAFDNDRHGGYAQISFRPDKVETPLLKNLEFAFRYDQLYQKDTPVGFDRRRYTIGLNYWFGPVTVLQSALQLDDRGDEGEASESNAILFQFATGF